MAKGQSVGKYFFDEFKLIWCVYDDQVEGSSYLELCAYSVFILCKHWRMNWSKADENNSVLFWQKKTCEIYFRISLISFSQKTSVIFSIFWGIFVLRQKTSQIQAEENRVNKDHSFTMQIYIELLWGDKLHRIRKRWNLAYAGEERFGFQLLNLTNFANGNS